MKFNRILLLGSGELGKEVAIELQRLGQTVIAADRYDGAPAMQVADERRVLAMNDPAALRALIDEVRPDIIIPEIEAIATSVLVDVERATVAQVVPSAKAVDLTMNREGIRRFVAEDLGIATSRYQFASTSAEFQAAVASIGLPCVVKPVQSSSGKGQSTIKLSSEIDAAWAEAQSGSRGGALGETQRVIVEGFVDFDYEITLLTARASNGVVFCEPVGHVQVDGDYRESWQPAVDVTKSDLPVMSPAVLAEAKNIADRVTAALTAESPTPWGLFGVELFIKGDEVVFSEVSPRPHDTGMVTLSSQKESEFALHAKAILGLPIYEQPLLAPAAASYALVVEGEGTLVVEGEKAALDNANVDLKIFGKPEIGGERRMGVLVSRAASVTEARTLNQQAASKLTLTSSSCGPRSGIAGSTTK